MRNLHWQSHAGPLRSIDTLHVELVPEGSVDPTPIFSPDPFFPASQRPASSATARDDGFQTQQIGAGGLAAPADTAEKTAGHRSTTPARRHQIPGLRRTPYLKVLMVRCDDNDAYKSSVRSEVRDWIKAHTQGSSTSKKANLAENHDSFEWIVIHVVIPNTVAATQPPVTLKGENGASEKPTSRWRPGSSTILEKLRSDFNSGSKGTVDHIAQIRIGINDVPYDSLPRVVPAVPSGYKETAEDSEAAWEDLMEKLRSLILASFDTRVTQYEEDIKEKDNQRSLPGWNFCTFFILKEGLARGFESVGLVEDALVGYDELSVGLDMIIKEQTAQGTSTTASALLSFTDELKQGVWKALMGLQPSEDDGEEVVDMQAPESKASPSSDVMDEIPISSTKKPYRELILENKVSVFDFRCYIFARQISLLLRLGNAWRTREELLAKLKEQQESVMHGVAPRALPPKHTENEHEDLSMLAEICRRTLEFIPSVSQLMRVDIQAALAAEKAKEGETPAASLGEAATQEVMNNLVASFAFSIAQQVLAQTSTKALPIPTSTMTPTDENEPKAAIPEPKTMMHPSRNSSLRVSTGGAGVGRPLPSPNIFPGPGNRTQSEQEVAKTSAFLKAGLEELAAKRADLYILCRNILEQSGKKRGWSDGWASVPVVGESSLIDLVEIDLNEDAPAAPEAKEGEEANSGPVVSIAGFENKLLRAALDSEEDFYRLYEILTDRALRHYTVASHTHSVQGTMADLAVLKYHVGDHSTASSYFWRTTPFFGESGWSLLELSMLIMYSRCLQQLQRRDDYVKVMLKLLSKAALAEKNRQQQSSSFLIREQQDAVEYPDSDAIKGFVKDLLSETKALPAEVRVPLANFFSLIEVDGTPENHDGRDSYSVYLRITSLLVDELEVERAKIRMVGHAGGMQREIWLELSDPAVLQPGRTKLKFNSNVSAPTHVQTLRKAAVVLEFANS